MTMSLEHGSISSGSKPYPYRIAKRHSNRQQPWQRQIKNSTPHGSVRNSNVTR